MTDTDWVVATDGGGAECLRCGEVLKLGLPMAVSVWVAAVRKFADLHAGCR